MTTTNYDASNSGASIPPPPPAPQAERPIATAPFVLGTVGTVIGLVPLLGLIAIPLGIIGLTLGVMAWRSRKRLARAATILSALAIVLGFWGMAIVSDAIDDFSDSVDCIANAETAAEMEACNG